MKQMLFVLAIAALAAPAFAAGIAWKGPGWYLVVDVEVDSWLSDGPFASKDECNAKVKEDDTSATYYCQEYKSDPGL